MTTEIASWFFPLVPFWTPNKLRGKHWSVSKKSADEWRGNVLAICGRAKNPCKVRRWLLITVTRRRRLDPDNEIASLKPVIDAIRRAGWIKNDSSKWLELVVIQVRDKIDSLRIELRDCTAELQMFRSVLAKAKAKREGSEP